MTYGGVVVLLHVFFTSAADGGEWLASRSWEGTLCTHLLGGWIGPRVVLDVVAKLKNPCLFQESNPGRPMFSQVTILTELPLYDPRLFNRRGR